jgi:hypothetical protein
LYNISVEFNPIGGFDMKLWIDDIRPAPEGYVWCKTVTEAKREILLAERGLSDPYDNYHPWNLVSIIDMDHDAGDYACFGGDYIKLLDWLEATNRNYPIRLHSMNPVGVENMRRIIQKNGWTEVR